MRSLQQGRLQEMLQLSVSIVVNFRFVLIDVAVCAHYYECTMHIIT